MQGDTETFRLEFSEQQQNFHHDNGTHEPETFGYTTIKESCDDLWYDFFTAYIDSKNICRSYTAKEIKKYAIEADTMLWRWFSKESSVLSYG